MYRMCLIANSWKFSGIIQNCQGNVFVVISSANTEAKYDPKYFTRKTYVSSLK